MFGDAIVYEAKQVNFKKIKTILKEIECLTQIVMFCDDENYDSDEINDIKAMLKEKLKEADDLIGVCTF